MNDLSKSVIFPIGEMKESSNFSGKVWMSILTTRDAPCRIANQTFAPASCNKWHKHPGGQILLVTGGRGYYQEWGKPAQELYPGSVVQIADNVKHWHGSAHDSWFVQITIALRPEVGPEWLEPVSDEDYKKLK